MRYRPLDANGDYTVLLPFLTNSPAAVRQLIKTRLKLWLGEWFLDQSDGVDYEGGVLGKAKNGEAVIKQCVLSTTGVDGLISFSATYDGGARVLDISGVAHTIYGETPFSALLTAAQ